MNATQRAEWREELVEAWRREVEWTEAQVARHTDDDDPLRLPGYQPDDVDRIARTIRCRIAAWRAQRQIP